MTVDITQAPRVQQGVAAKSGTAVAARGAGTVLELRGDQQWWSQRQIDTLRTLGVQDDVLPAELLIFQHVAQRARLDPFAKQIYLIGRWDGLAKRKVYRPQTAIDGFRLIAERSGRYAGRVGPLWCADDGVWREIWSGGEPPAAAKVGVRHYDTRGVLHETWATVMFGEYVVTNKDGKPTGKWGTMPANQIAKCGEAQAIRTVFPDETAGLVVAEEAERDDDDARRAHAVHLSAGAARRSAIEHEQLVSSVTRPSAAFAPAERGTAPTTGDIFTAPLPVDPEFEAWVADDAARAEAAGAPVPDRAQLEALLAAVAVAGDVRQLSELASEAYAAFGVQKITERGQQLVRDAAARRRDALGAGPVAA